jgi:hypothetical protein
VGAAHQRSAIANYVFQYPAYAAAAFVTAIALLAAAGCGRPGDEYESTVTGTVTIDGELAKSGTMTFHQMDKGTLAIGRIKPDGSYSLRTGQGGLRQLDGSAIMPGKYSVTVSITGPPVSDETVVEGGPPSPGPSLIAVKYAQKGTTDLRYTVKPGKQVIVLNLERAEAEPKGEAAGASPANDSPAGVEVDQAVDTPVEDEAPVDNAGAQAEQQANPENRAP